MTFLRESSLTKSMKASWVRINSPWTFMPALRAADSRRSCQATRHWDWESSTGLHFLLKRFYSANAFCVRSCYLNPKQCNERTIFWFSSLIQRLDYSRPFDLQVTCFCFQYFGISLLYFSILKCSSDCALSRHLHLYDQSSSKNSFKNNLYSHLSV